MVDETTPATETASAQKDGKKAVPADYSPEKNRFRDDKINRSPSGQFADRSRKSARKR